MLQIGIVGLPNVGKSTLFQALTKKQVDTSNYPFATIDPNVGVVAVPDFRLAKLAELSHSKKTIPATIEFVDIAGLVKGAHEGEGLGNKFLSHIREVDAIAEVVRTFEKADIHHVSGRINPNEDRDIIHTELVLADLDTVERAVARQEKEAKIGGERGQKKLEVYKNMRDHLAGGKRATDFFAQDEESIKVIHELQLLTSKPIICVFNINENSEKDFRRRNLRHDFVGGFASESCSVALNIKLEDDIAQLGEDAGEFKNESHLDDLITKAYEVLGLITFLTTGEDETRAWAIPKDATAPRAGRAIHSDFEEKFIRAEIISYENLMKAGSYAKARELGLLQTKGKDYIVQDGDVIEFKI
ncbi:MAG: redox-regulated ATPase YchF [Candidatus Ryanbacteria bacterium RIFCSPHIGHO2_02_FULL_45_17b]|uniref:Ribosome-binding ATPase YchF n=1 Tax=Candidatus Ryanbacteria bacterium RIFCSPHIGHO2_01_FULL_45_22 TaxID=1802114 RepID=A0A1G2G3T3_9BACT|nr:MAG: redox-regulated ATPase YchF [Candidatus Ryanbacteria bacterium RIFCSPHIGHO2_01_FULL_45_22]OGZ47634.1 MAG: redox-regulated ATPase YchF [Candidatus Ryanbacteria bacterium RIFCSPHIGHO2_02_FULL_45_17b]